MAEPGTLIPYSKDILTNAAMYDNERAEIGREQKGDSVWKFLGDVHSGKIGREDIKRGLSDIADAARVAFLEGHGLDPETLRQRYPLKESYYPLAELIREEGQAHFWLHRHLQHGEAPLARGDKVSLPIDGIDSRVGFSVIHASVLDGPDHGVEHSRLGGFSTVTDEILRRTCPVEAVWYLLRRDLGSGRS